MKLKICFLTLLSVVLVFGLATSSQAVIALDEHVVIADNTPVAAGDSIAVGSYVLTAADTDAIVSFTIISGDGDYDVIAATDIDDHVSLYEDVNANGAFDAGLDTFVLKTDAADFHGAGVAVPYARSFTAAATVYYIVVVPIAKNETAPGTIDGKLIDCILNVNAVGAVEVTNDILIDVVATHLHFNEASLLGIAAATANFVTGADVSDFLTAIDDLGNLDVGFGEVVKLSAEQYTSPGTAHGVLTAVSNTGGTDLVVDGIAMLNGKWLVDAGTNATSNIEEVSNTVAGDMILVATSANNLQGSFTVLVGDAYTTVTGVASTRGVEFYDTDHNGKLDHCTLFFNAPLNFSTSTNIPIKADGTGSPASAYSAGYVITGNPVVNFDAGGTGIRNAGAYGVTLTLTEGAVETGGAMPQVGYNSATGFLEDNNIPTAAPSIVGASAVEIDKASPILMSVNTEDADADGKVEGIVLTFSEVVQAIVAGATSGTADPLADEAVVLSLVLQDGTAVSISLNGTETVDGKTTTLGVNETLPNTGVLPILQVAYGIDDIKDSATNAIGAPAANAYNPDFTNFAAGLLDFNVNDGASPVINNVETGEAVGNVDGKIDEIVVTFSEDMSINETYAFTGVTFYSTVFGAYAVTAGAISDVDDAIITYTVTELADVYDTESKPVFRYDPAVAGAKLLDANGFALAKYTEEGGGGRVQTDIVATTDGAAPVMAIKASGDVLTDSTYTGASAFEADGANGRLDTIVIEFSEQIQTDNMADGLSDIELDDIITQFVVKHEDMGGIGAGLAVTITDADDVTPGPAYDAKAVPTLVHASTAGDTKSTLTLHFREVTFANLTDAGLTLNRGDTGVILTVDYTQATGLAADDIKDLSDVVLVTIGADPATDAAPPFIVDGLLADSGGSFTGNEFANITTIDTDVVTNGYDIETGDGYIDKFQVQFSETVFTAGVDTVTVSGAFVVTNTDLSGITISAIDVDMDGDVNLDADEVADTVDTDLGIAGFNTCWLVGSSAKLKDLYDTGATPTLTYAVEMDFADLAGNQMAAFGPLPSYDGCAPVPALAVGGVDTDEIKVIWSEAVYRDNAGAVFIAGDTGDAIFGYSDGDEAGVSALLAADLTMSDNVMTIKTDGTLSLADVESDSLWVMTANKVFDDANATFAGVAAGDNVAENSASGVGFKIIINDIIAPWITAAVTVDADGNGYIDHIRFVFSELIDDATLNGYVSADAMTDDESATWQIEGYAGTAKFNLFTTDAAAFAAGEPRFTDNAANDNVLYLKIEEAGLAATATHEMGNTGYTGILTVIAAVADPDSVTLSDNKPNGLDVASAEATAINSGDNLTDTAGPVLMYAQTTSTQTMEAWLSEELDDTTVQPADFAWTICNYGGSYQGNAVCVTMPAVDIAQLKVTTANAWDADMGGRLSITAGMTDTTAVVSNASDSQAYGAAMYLSAADVQTVLTGAWPLEWAAATNVGFVDNYIEIVVGFTGSGIGGPVDPPADLVLTDVPDDNGHWMFATFTVSADHLTRVKSYQFYREVDFGTVDVPDLKWVYSAVVPAGVATDGKMVCFVPSVIDGLTNWAIVASTGDVVTDLPVASKEAAIPVAQLVEGAEKAAEGITLSEMSVPVEGGSIDNVAPSPITTWAVDDNEGADAGILISWDAPADHIAVTTEIMGVKFYGVDGYEIYRKESGTLSIPEHIGTAASLSPSYVDVVEDGITVYEYYVIAVDSNPDHDQTTGAKLAMAFAGGANFNSDPNNIVDVGDLVLFGAQWSKKAADTDWISAYDLNGNLEIEVGDLVLLGAAWTSAGKVAKLALPVTSDVALTMSADYDGSSSIYYVNVNVSEAEGFNGIGFTMSYDMEALELVENGISGLGEINITKQLEEGMIDINSYFMDDEFDGTITVAFKSRGMSKDLDFELANPSVSIDNVISAVGDVALTVDAIPAVYSLAQNFPNPFNPTTTIEYSIPQSGHVELVIYNMAAQKVCTLVNENQTAAFRRIVWDGKNDMGETVGAGLYFYKLVSGNFSKIQKMTLIK